MTTIDQRGDDVGRQKEGILDREHTIAKAGFNRWLVPPAALCIHLCIGMAYGFSVFWLPLSRAVGLDGAEGLPRHVAVAGIVHHHLRLESRQPGLDVHAVLRAARRFGRDLGRLARARRSAQGRRRRGAVLGRRPVDRRLRRLRSSALDHVARRRRDRRRRSRPRLHFSGVDADQMVPRSPRHGDRFCHHGLRRRRHDRRAAGESPDQLLQDSDRRSASGKPSPPWA